MAFMTAELAEPGEMSVSADSHMGHHCSCLILISDGRHKLVNNNVASKRDKQRRP